MGKTSLPDLLILHRFIWNFSISGITGDFIAAYGQFAVPCGHIPAAPVHTPFGKLAMPQNQDFRLLSHNPSGKA